MSDSLIWRGMTAADLPGVAAIAEIVHPAYPEDAGVFRERLELYPAGCFVLQAESGLAGYVISHPWHVLRAPALNTLLGALPEAPETYYLHDIALLPSARGTGAGRRILERLYVWPEISLVAVGGSRVFWERQGFRAVPAPALEGYGAGVFMRRRS